MYSSPDKIFRYFATLKASHTLLQHSNHPFRCFTKTEATKYS
jgi:hypothetical protein